MAEVAESTAALRPPLSRETFNISKPPEEKGDEFQGFIGKGSESFVHSGI